MSSESAGEDCRVHLLTRVKPLLTESDSLCIGANCEAPRPPTNRLARARGMIVFGTLGAIFVLGTSFPDFISTTFHLSTRTANSLTIVTSLILGEMTTPFFGRHLGNLQRAVFSVVPADAHQQDGYIQFQRMNVVLTSFRQIIRNIMFQYFAATKPNLIEAHQALERYELAMERRGLELSAHDPIAPEAPSDPSIPRNFVRAVDLLAETAIETRHQLPDFSPYDPEVVRMVRQLFTRRLRTDLSYAVYHAVLELEGDEGRKPEVQLYYRRLLTAWLAQPRFYRSDDRESLATDRSSAGSVDYSNETQPE